MNRLKQVRRIVVSLVLVLVMTVTTACSSGTSNVAQLDRTNSPVTSRNLAYAEIERGNTPAGETFANWVVQTSKGLIKDAYMRDNNKLGVVISPQVRPDEVRPLAKSLVQGFRRNFPNQDLKVLVYAPDKQLILTADYDIQSNQLQYT